MNTTRNSDIHATWISLAIIAGIFIFSWAPQRADARQETVISGKTMGTYYRIKYIDPRNRSKRSWEKKVSVCLRDINRKMSIFDSKSELSSFNRAPADQPVRLSSDFYNLLFFSARLHKMTNGAWDGTIKPLVDLWGFGNKTKKKNIPDTSQIHAALGRIGFDQLIFIDDRHALKKRQISIDLGSIAKGYGVDRILELFQRAGIKDVLVDIGGELSATGKNASGNIWSVAITRPVKGKYNPEPFAIVQLENRAIATSGDYRNFFKQGGKAYSHIIDPRTGFPVSNKITSASVIAPDCMTADGLATALMVMDIPSSLELINSLKDVECLIISFENGKLIPHQSKQFDTLVRQ